jgi:hypothetical protein
MSTHFDSDEATLKQSSGDRTAIITKDNIQQAMKRKQDKLEDEGISFLTDPVQQQDGAQAPPNEDQILDMVMMYLICTKVSEAQAAKPNNKQFTLKKLNARARKIILAGFSDEAQAELRQETTIYDMMEAAGTYFYPKKDLQSYRLHKADYEKIKFSSKSGMASYLSKILTTTAHIKSADPLGNGISNLDRQLKIATDVKKMYPDLAKDIIKKIKEMQGLQPAQLPRWKWLRGQCITAETEAKDDEDTSESSSDDDDGETTAEKKSALATSKGIQDAIKQGIAAGVKAAMSTMGASHGKSADYTDKRAQKCNYCGKTRHLEEECWKKHPDKKPEWAKRRVGEGGSR